MDFGAVLVATCIASGVATLMMGLLANYPIAVVPAMGHNFYFAFTVVVAMHVPWQTALGAVALAGLVFILTAGVGLRERLIPALPNSLKHAAVGIGLLVALIGLEWGGVVRASPGMSGVRDVAWDDPTQAIPAFLTIVMMPLTVSITDGVALGVSAYAALKLATGRGREAHALVYVFAILFLLPHAFLIT